MRRAVPAPLVRSLLAAFAAIGRTWRIVLSHGDGRMSSLDDYAWTPPVLHALSERDAIAFAYAATRHRVVTLVAPGRDGDWATTAMRASGADVHRGAEQRLGYEGALALIHDLRQSPRPAALIVDGPLGPAGLVKPGVVTCAAAAGLAIRPIAAATSRALTFPRTWSGIYLPLPWSTVVFAAAPDIAAAGGDADARRAVAARITADLVDAGRRAVDIVHQLGTGRL